MRHRPFPTSSRIDRHRHRLRRHLRLMRWLLHGHRLEHANHPSVHQLHAHDEGLHEHLPC